MFEVVILEVPLRNCSNCWKRHGFGTLAWKHFSDGMPHRWYCDLKGERINEGKIIPDENYYEPNNCNSWEANLSDMLLEQRGI